ncbi:MAG: YolD-like family protein [Candidatus Cohnella colombiensis]|uniref:YolD-like family protein n=1 Tax=Candidatus Cohnella colombiensis TaxID=3121368 RepID=A0AA95EWJ4_9BACL|nr:MAG: YolD-like family protein [Cohnella sp.]
MSKKLENNGLWESSRMMLPEHKERIIALNHEPERRTKPVLDPQQWEEINDRLSEASQTGEVVQLRVWNPRGDRVISGSLVKIDVLGYRIFVDGQWVKLANILEVTISSS